MVLRDVLVFVDRDWEFGSGVDDVEGQSVIEQSGPGSFACGVHNGFPGGGVMARNMVGQAWKVVRYLGRVLGSRSRHGGEG